MGFPPTGCLFQESYILWKIITLFVAGQIHSAMFRVEIRQQLCPINSSVLGQVFHTQKSYYDYILIMICILFSKIAGSHSSSVESVGKNGRSNSGKKMVELLDRQIDQN